MRELVDTIGGETATILFQNFVIRNACQCPYCLKIFDRIIDPNIIFRNVCLHVKSCQIDTEKLNLNALYSLALKKFSPKLCRLDRHRPDYVVPERKFEIKNKYRKLVLNKVYTCKWCGKTDLIGPHAMGNHTRNCKKNPLFNPFIGRRFKDMLKAAKKNQRKDLRELIKSPECENMIGKLIIRDDTGAVGEI